VRGGIKHTAVLDQRYDMSMYTKGEYMVYYTIAQISSVNIVNYNSISTFILYSRFHLKRPDLPIVDSVYG